MPDYNSPTAVANQALSAIGVDKTLGDIEEGTKEAVVCLQFYGECVRQLIRAAHWDWARIEAPLLLLADAGGSTPNVGNKVPSGFMYEYAYPTDCAKIRYIPWSPFQNPGVPAGNIVPPNNQSPLVTGQSTQPNMRRIVPAPYLLTGDFNNPPPGGTDPQRGISAQARLVILTNVQNAKCVYTQENMSPYMWDHLFRSALVAYLASEIAVRLHKEKPDIGIRMRDDQIKIFTGKLQLARQMNGNESWASSDLSVDWINTRFSGSAYGNGNGWSGGGGMGGMGGWGGYDSVLLSNGSAY